MKGYYEYENEHTNKMVGMEKGYKRRGSLLPGLQRTLIRASKDSFH